MALRLTRNTLAASEPATDILSSPSALAAAARAALIAGDLGRFHQLAQHVTGEADDNRRYHLRTKLVDGAFEAARSASNAIARQAFVAAAGLTVAALEDEPREPVLLNLAGVALYELWALDAAHALFRAALKLDP